MAWVGGGMEKVQVRTGEYRQGCRVQRVLLVSRGGLDAALTGIWLLSHRGSHGISRAETIRRESKQP